MSELGAARLVDDRTATEKKTHTHTLGAGTNRMRGELRIRKNGTRRDMVL